MPVYFVEKDYIVELVYLTIKCSNCELNTEVTVFSDQKQRTVECPCCGHMLEIRILVCPECNSSQYVVEKGFGGHYCEACEKVLSEW